MTVYQRITWKSFRNRVPKANMRGNRSQRAFERSGVCQSGDQENSEFSEQIDLLIRLGPLLIVGEVKCWLYPADAIERFNQLRKLRKAAEQVKRKANALRARPDVAAKALGLSEELCQHLRVVPLVVSNQGFGFSLDLGGCFVTDAAFLKRYLDNGSLVIGYASDVRTGAAAPMVATMYERESQAAERIERNFRDPVVLRRFEQRISWEKIPFPTPIGETVSSLLRD